MLLVDLEPGDSRLEHDVLAVLRELRPHFTAAGFAAVYEEGYPQGLRYLAAFDGDRCVGVAGWATAVVTGIAAGSAMVFLGAMDTLWNIQHGNYRRMTPEMLVESAINVASLVFGPLTMLRLWRRRHAFDG